MVFVRRAFGSFCSAYVNSGKSWHRERELKSRYRNQDNRCGNYGMGHGFSHSRAKRTARNQPEKLDFSDTFRNRNRRFVALLLPRAPARRGVKGCSHRQAERCSYADFGVYFPARGIYRKIAYRVHFNRRGNADYGYLIEFFRQLCSVKTAPASQTQSKTARTVF